MFVRSEMSSGSDSIIAKMIFFQRPFGTLNLNRSLSTITLGMAIGYSSLLLAGSESQTTYHLDTDKSRIVWHGEKLVGDKQVGTLHFSKGEIKFRKGKPVYAVFTVDMPTLKNTNIKSKKFREKLEAHLKSEDFFYVKKFPKAEFRMNTVHEISKDKYQFTGKLVIKGVTHPTTVVANVKIVGEILNAEGKLEFDRTLYEVRYGSGKFFENLGDKIISDSIKLDLHVVARQDKTKKTKKESTSNDEKPMGTVKKTEGKFDKK